MDAATHPLWVGLQPDVLADCRYTVGLKPDPQARDRES